MREIEDHPVVSSLCFIRAIGRDKSGYRANLRCDCKQVGPVRMSSKRPTLQDCLRELGRLIQQDHVPTCVAAAQELQVAEKDAGDVSTKRPADEGAASRNANDVLMLRAQVKSLGERAVIANKVALEAEKTRDELHNQIEHIEEQLYPKRARTHDDAGDAHEMLEEVGKLGPERPPSAGNACTWPRTRIQVLWTESHGGRLYAHQTDLLDRRRIYCHSIIRDSES